MTKYTKLRNNSNLSKFLILEKGAIWVAEINEREHSIEEAFNEKKLHGKTKFYRYHEMKNIIFDEDRKTLILNFMKDDEGKNRPSVKIEIPSGNYNQVKNDINKTFFTKNIEDMTFMDRHKDLILVMSMNVILLLVLYFYNTLDLELTGYIALMALIEFVLITKFSRAPKNGKILKLN